MDPNRASADLLVKLGADPEDQTHNGRSCAALAAQWQAYVARTRSLRKVFVSIKGFYYQAEVNGTVLTWVVPHTFAQQPTVAQPLMTQPGVVEPAVAQPVVAQPLPSGAPRGKRWLRAAPTHSRGCTVPIGVLSASLVLLCVDAQPH